MQFDEQLASRPNISAHLATTLRAMIVDGRLPAGERINEVHVAAKLGVSRTPLREALMRLAAEGAVTVLPRIGFSACPLTVEELEQIYPMRALLDPEALRLAGLPSPERIAKLKTMNARLRRISKPETVLALDDEWHRELIADCPNGVLLALIEQFIWRTRRYELALMRSRRNIESTTDEHAAVIEALEAGNLKRACAALRRNMETGKEPIVAWLKEREK
jgi:DNA-binding GntR family transcriptional regulator